MPDGADAYPAYGDCAVFMPDGADAYPAYGDGAVFMPDGAALIRPTGSCGVYAGWCCAYPAYIIVQAGFD
ncbi:hypothetical protein [Kosakonia cowanii]|uniref:hypothetical protein n=1 Tax=Kosakonia cowanii TaxID=208223 RepID=UPI003208E984